MSGLTPDPMFAGQLEGHATWNHALDLGLAVLIGRDTTTADAGSASFTWIAARPGACWVVTPRFQVSACGHVEAGVILAKGDQIVNDRDLTRLWLALGGHVAARYPLGPHVSGQLQLGASVPLIRDRFIFAST